MKTMKEDNFTTAGTLLKKQGHLEDNDDGVYCEKNFKVTDTPQVDELAMRSVLHSCAGENNALGFVNTTFKFDEADEQYKRFLEFVREASEPYKSELTYLLFPIFVNIYIEFVSKNRSSEAGKFFRSHCDLFLKAEGFQEVIQDLNKLTTLKSILYHSYFKQFREEKYNIQLSEDALQYFVAYLKDVDNTILLDVLNSYFCIESDSFLYSEDELSEKSSDLEEATEDTQLITTKKAPAEDENVLVKVSPLEELQTAIKRIAEGPPCIPSTYLYTITTSDDGICAAQLSRDGALIAAGFESSVVRLWSLMQEQLISEPAPADVSHIYLGCDELKEHVYEASHEKVLRGHGGAVYGMSFSPCRQALFTCSEDCTVRAWSMRSFKNTVLYTGHNSPIWDLDTSQNYSYFATASKDSTARLWTTDRTFPIRILPGHESDVNCVKFHPNSNYVATGSSDASIRMWSVQSGNMVRVFKGHVNGITAIAFSPNGQLLASAGEDFNIKIWDLRTSEKLKELHGHKDTIHSICFNGDSSLLASGGFENALKIWNLRQEAANSSVSTSSEASLQERASPELLASLPTHSASLHLVHSWQNLLVAVGNVIKDTEDCSMS